MKLARAFTRPLTALTLSAAFLLTSCGTETKSGIKDVSSAKYTEIALGSDFTDLNAKLTFVTNRTDLIQDTPNGREFPDYIAEFNALYPGISVTVEGITDYDTDMTARLSAGNWGDICCIPSAVSSIEYSQYFEPIADYDDIKDSYEFMDQLMYEGKVYGIPTSANVQGIVYNKRIWEEAGVTELPKTPDEFLNALQRIRDNTDAIPLYTNYQAIWPLGTWDTYVFSCATGDETYRNFVLPHEQSPFSNVACRAKRKKLTRKIEKNLRNVKKPSQSINS